MSSILRASVGATLALGVVTTFALPSMAGPVNINSADAATMARELQGIGLKRAQAIVDYRVKHGPFKSAEELALVKGIGTKAIERNKADIRTDVRGPASPSSTRKPVAKPDP